MPAHKKYFTEEERIAARRSAVRKCDAKPENRLKKREREKLRCITDNQRKRKIETDRVRNSKSENKEKRNARRRAQYQAKCAAEGKRPQPRCYATKEERSEAKTRWWLNWRNKNPEKYKKHVKESNIRNNTRRARKLGNGGTHTAADIRQLYFLQHGKCTWCSEGLGETGNHVDHWIPLAKGGTNDKTNLRLLHKKCNLSKGTKDPRELGLISLTA